MLLVIDVGNTNTCFGVFKGDELIFNWRIATKIERTSDELAILTLNFFQFKKILSSEIKGVIISCVVPPLLNSLIDMLKRYFSISPLIVGPGIKTGMPILYKNPKEVGADRIVNAVAAYEKYKRDVIAVDFGTATTFDYVSKNGEYVGGAISPGIMISVDALFQQTSKLPRIELIKPATVIGKDTIHSMQAGIIYGFISLVDGIVERIKMEVGGEPPVIATGGIGNLIFSDLKTITEYDEFLTLKGLKIIYERNR